MADTSVPEKFGTLLGHAPGGVPIYSSHYPSADPVEYPDRAAYHSEMDGVYLGYKWQCVEFARRWLYLNHGCVFDDVPMAYDIFRLHHLTRVADQQLLPLYAFRNGAPRPPEVGSLLIWAAGGDFDVTGHVAVVTEVMADRVRFAEQNVGHHRLPEGQDWSRELPLHRTAEGGYELVPALPGARILGWMIQTADARHAERHSPSDPALYRLDARLADRRGQHLRPWLDPEHRAEAAYLKANGGHRLLAGSRPEDDYRYFRLSETAREELVRATNELHLMFLHATQAVLGDDSLLEKFCIPRSLWPRLRRSWEHRRTEVITGRFDFCVSERGIKVYEYNADSASCHMEAGLVQQRWAEHFGVTEGDSAGAGLFDALVKAWQAAAVGQLLHILRDRDREEAYHAEYIRDCAEAAGIRCKVITGVAGLSWDADGGILDRDGEPVTHVWKTWAWETALDQIRAECEADDAAVPLRDGSDAHPAPPRLVDVLLRPEVMVYEPFWTLIPSNKAILPVLSQIFPQHPYLLPASFELTPFLREHGHVSKPIVGRCGDNICLVDGAERLLDETGGKFEARDHIYQELWRLPEIDGFRAQVCTFTARGKYAGACLRVDRSLIITGASDIAPLRVVADEALASEAGAAEAR